MGSPRKKAKKGGATAGPSAWKNPFVWVIIPAMAVLAFVLWPRDPVESSPSVVAPQSATPTATNPEVSKVEPAQVATRPPLERLEGRWLRPDGGYVLEIRDVKSDGVCQAVYLNPRPIHVSRARADEDGSSWKLFVELSDVGYPGSTYTLQYDAATDAMNGIYYQAAQQMSFEVKFVRMD